ncbi:uncharacterized protein [Brachyistius frenatus]|uniref:uncharacterized protein n=1 Tax=Brachyistius frenatus TaxID=100188 RepID=UPI0037E86AB3
MSQSHNPSDTQGLLQSMLQRLKLQPGTEGLHTPVPITAASTWGHDGERGASNLQKVNNSPVKDFGFSTNGIPSKKFWISAVDSNFGFEGGEIQQPGQGCEVERGLTSFSQKDNIDGVPGETRVLGQAKWPAITPTGTRQLFLSKSLKDADITSSERTDGDRVSFGSSAITKPFLPNTVGGSIQNQDQGFTDKLYVWSLKSTNIDGGGHENNGLNMENGGLGVLAQSKDVQIVSSSSSSRRNHRSSENKTRRWTQRIKERWKDRPGNFGKKGKEEGGTAEQKSEQGTEISPLNQVLTAENMINAPTRDGERILYSLDSSDPSNTLPAHTESSTTDGHTRSTSNFDLGLGSFSLLEEIVKGQEWAKFLNPNLSTNSANQRPSGEPLIQPKIQPNPHDSTQSSGILKELGGGRSQWSFRTESSPATVFSVAQISPDASLPVSMDVSEGKQQECVHRGAYNPEPMEDGQNQAGMQTGESRLGQQLRPPSFVEPADNQHNSAQRGKVQLNRKRQHQAAERLLSEKIRDGEEANREGSISSPSRTSSHVMAESGESQHDNVIPLYILNSHPTPLSPTSSNDFSPAPRGVLKHFPSLDSESSMETVTKRRRVEENRRVHFSEELVTVVSSDLDLHAMDSEEDSGPGEDSVSERECEVEQAVIEEVAPARRPALPAWIMALKRRNPGRKHR